MDEAMEDAPAARAPDVGGPAGGVASTSTSTYELPWVRGMRPPPFLWVDVRAAAPPPVLPPWPQTHLVSSPPPTSPLPHATRPARTAAVSALFAAAPFRISDLDA